MGTTNLGRFRINPKGEWDSTKQYEFLDAVSYLGSSYVCINNDTEDRYNVGIPPVGNTASGKYYMLLAEKGDKGDTGTYDSFITVEDNKWDYSLSDKIIIPEDAPNDKDNPLIIENLYDGCCGVIVSKKDLFLPTYSDYSIDFDYLSIRYDTEYYLYSFICMDMGSGLMKPIWNRTIINEQAY